MNNLTHCFLSIGFIFGILLSAELTKAQSIKNLNYSELPQLTSLNEMKIPNSNDGKLVVLDFWASWCGPCKQSLPEYNKLALKFKNKVIWIAMNEDGEITDGIEFLKKKNFDFYTAFDKDKKYLKGFGYNTIPVLIVFNSKGEILFKHRGYDTESAKEIEIKLSKLTDQF